MQSESLNVLEFVLYHVMFGFCESSFLAAPWALGQTSSDPEKHVAFFDSNARCRACGVPGVSTPDASFRGEYGSSHLGCEL